MQAFVFHLNPRAASLAKLRVSMTTKREKDAKEMVNFKNRDTEFANGANGNNRANW